MSKTYSDLIMIPDYLDRFEYLKVGGKIGVETFGSDRYLNQILYKSPEWKSFRRDIIIRDNGCDLAHKDHPGFGRMVVHHINPITVEDVLNRDSRVFDPENVVCVTHMTHEALHYGSVDLLPKDPIERKPNDTCPWR